MIYPLFNLIRTCDRLIKEYLKRLLKIEVFSQKMIESGHNIYQMRKCDSGKILGLGVILPGRSVRIFIHPSFQGSLGMSKTRTIGEVSTDSWKFRSIKD